MAAIAWCGEIPRPRVMRVSTTRADCHAEYPSQESCHFERRPQAEVEKPCHREPAAPESSISRHVIGQPGGRLHPDSSTARIRARPECLRRPNCQGTIASVQSALSPSPRHAAHPMTAELPPATNTRHPDQRHGVATWKVVALAPLGSSQGRADPNYD